LTNTRTDRHNSWATTKGTNALLDLSTLGLISHKLEIVIILLTQDILQRASITILRGLTIRTNTRTGWYSICTAAIRTNALLNLSTLSFI